MMRRLFWAAAVVFLLILIMAPSPTVAIVPHAVTYDVEGATAALTEWTVPTPNSLPTGLALDPSGKCCWFVESQGNKIVHLDPTTNTFREWGIPTPDSKPTSVALTTMSGTLAIFGTESAKEKVFLFLPDTGVFREYTLPSDSGPQRISIEADQVQVKAWFTKVKGNSVGEIVYDPSSKTARLYELALPPASGGAVRSVYAGSGIIWFAGTSAILRWDMSAKQFTSWPIPYHASTETVFVTVDALGGVWYTSTSVGTSSANSYVGVLRSDNTFTEWQVPTIGADVRAVTINPVTQNPWVVEYGTDKIAKLDPSIGGTVTTSRPTTAKSDFTTGAIFTHVAGPVLPSTVKVPPVASTPGMSSTDQFTEWMLAAGSGSQEIVVDASGAVWVLESSTNKVARLSLASDFLVGCDPSSLIMMQSSNATSTCTVTSVDGFASAVELAGSWIGSQPSNVVFTLPTPVTPPPGRAVSSSLIISAGPTASTGTLNLQITGTSGSMTHNTNLTVTIAAGIADFTVTASPWYLSIPPGGSGASTITVQSLGVFFSPVSLMSPDVPEGMRLVFGTNPVTPPIGETSSSLATITVSGARAGTHIITIRGTSGPLVHSTTITVEVPGAGSPCLIATATYGSELSDEVQFLRNFRDKSVLKTNTGSSFMVVFNAWYYYFSPGVARFIGEHSAVRTVAKFALYPLIRILTIGAAVFSLFPTSPEAAAVTSGLIISSLIGAVYAAPLLAAFLAYSSRARRIAKKLQLPAIALLSGTLVALDFTTVLGGPRILLMMLTSGVVLASLATSGLFVSRGLLHVTQRLQHGWPSGLHLHERH